MNPAALTRQVAKFLWSLVFIGGAYVLIHRVGVLSFAEPDAEALGVALTVIGAIYAVVFAFVIFVIWGQFTDVQKSTARECSLLSDVVRFAHYLNPDSDRLIRRGVLEYAARVVNGEWHSLSEGRRDQGAEKAHATLVSNILRLEPVNDAELPITAMLLDLIRKAAEQRDQRITQSLTRIPPTLIALVRLMAAAMIVLQFVHPFRSVALGAGCFAALYTILFVSNLVMTDTDNPFDGIFNVSAQPFSELAH